MKVGCDIVQISRIKDEPSFVSFVLHPNELPIYEKRAKKTEFLAGRFAVKEALSKALGVGLSGLKFSEVDVSYEKTGAPFILYNGKRYSCSISHDGDYAFAVVVI